jgi:transglutaminase-like putative cysteine protease
MRFYPQSGGCRFPQTISSETIADGDAGVHQTIALMETLVRGPEGIRSPDVRQAALDAVRGSERGLSEIDAVFSWVRDNIEFRGEYSETLQTPKMTLYYRAGDCDDQAILQKALLASLGFRTRFVTMALRESPEDLSHVYVEVWDRTSRRWLPVDTTVTQSYPGWVPDDVVRQVEYAPTSAPSALADGVIAMALLLAFGI